MSRQFWANEGVANGRRIAPSETVALGSCGTDPSRKLRADALPEHLPFHDTGCDLYPACLACPLVKCRYDTAPGPGPLARNVERNKRMVAMAKGSSIDDIAAMFGLSRGTVFRVLRAARQECARP